MSGFGLRAFKKQVSEEEKTTKKEFISHIVIGRSVNSYLKFKELKGQGKEVKWISSIPYHTDDARKDHQTYPQILRGEEGYPVSFYKDSKFHKLGGRAKIHELKEEEKFFQAGYLISEAPEFLNDFDETIKENQLVKNIERISKYTTDDLGNEISFSLFSGENEEFQCRYLHFGAEPSLFLSLCDNKNELGDELLEKLHGIRGNSAICLSYECEKKILDPQTLILPQSQTHEWGSIVCDFLPENNEGKQLATALLFLEEEEKTEEELAKKVKLITRTINRVIEGFEGLSSEPLIKFYPEFFFNGLNSHEAGTDTLKFL